MIVLVLFLILNETLLSATVGYDNSTSLRASISQTSSACPPWFIFDNATQQCECGDDIDGVKCDIQYKRVYISNCFCMTHDDIQGTVAGACMINCFINKQNQSFKYYNELPSSLIQLNKVMCEDDWNRGGRLCGRCKDGYHPLVYSYDMRCVECKDAKYNWLWFIVAAFVLLTFFFIFVASCGISASSPQLEAFVAIAQAFATPANARIVLGTTMIDYNPSTTLICQFIFACYGIWNLDFFRTLLPPICLRITRLQALALDYLIAFYPLVLIVITYILIDLYDRRFCVLVWLWKPFSKCLKSDFNAKPAFINAFITFLTLSYVKLISVSFDLLVYINVYNSSGENLGAYLFHDASIKYFGQEHLPYAILAILVVIIFIVLPLMFSLLHSLRCLNRCIGRWPSLHVCFDSLQGYYKDGTDGTHNCRWFSSLYLIVRIALFFVYGFVKYSFYPLASILLLILVALIVTVQPFKPQYGVYNTIHALLFLNLSMWFMTDVLVTYDSQLTIFAFILSAIVAILPLFYVIGLVSKWIHSKTFCHKHSVSKLCCFMRRHGYDVSETVSIDSIPYRSEYEQHDEQKVLHLNPVDGGSSMH